jgi:predicted PurR-regulated permease PerM
LVLGIRYALLWGILVALVDALPVLGTGAVLIPWSLISFLESNSPRALGLLGLYAIVALTRSVLEPRLVGKQLGLDPLLTLACLYAGFQLWEVAGMIFAPLLAVAIRQFVPLFGKNSPLE